MTVDRVESPGPWVVGRLTLVSRGPALKKERDMHFYYNQNEPGFDRMLGKSITREVKVDGQWVPFTFQCKEAQAGKLADSIQYLGEIKDAQLRINGIIQEKPLM